MIATICAYDVIRHLNTPKGRSDYLAARNATRTDFGALCVVTRKVVPFYDEIEAVSEIAAEVAAIRNA